jgi:hypothetical protein
LKELLLTDPLFVLALLFLGEAELLLESKGLGCDPLMLVVSMMLSSLMLSSITSSTYKERVWNLPYFGFLFILN